MKKVVAFLLTLMMLLSSVAFAAEYPEYLNLDSSLPVVKEGYEDQAPTLSVMCLKRDGGADDFNDLWIAEYIAEYLNVKLDVEMIQSSAALAERKTLMFASQELPDIIMNCGISTAEVVTYGVMNGQLLAMDEYVSEELTPNMWKYFTEVPAIKGLAVATDGHMYTLPKIISVENEGDLKRLFLNHTWLEETGMEDPRTLDEFIDLLYKIKELHPESIPLNGAIDYQNPGYFILNAMGFVSRSTDGYGYTPFTRNGEYVMPVTDPLFKEYLTIMNQFYNDGIITENFILADKVEIDANITTNVSPICYSAPYGYSIETWDQWESIYPLTSEWSDTPVVNQPSAGGAGGFAISADTEYPELCMRFADVFFAHDHTPHMMWVGPKDGSEEALGHPGNVSTEAGDYWTFEQYPEGESDLWSWLVNNVSFYADFGSNDDPAVVDLYVEYITGNKPAYKNFDLGNPDQHYRHYVWQKQWPYVTEDTFPSTYYLTEDQILLRTDLETVIQPYVREQVALFITGGRDIETFDAFQEELKAMGIEDLKAIYQGIWDTYKAAL